MAVAFDIISGSGVTGLYELLLTLFRFVGMVGVEPTWTGYRQILSLVRLANFATSPKCGSAGGLCAVRTKSLL